MIREHATEEQIQTYIDGTAGGEYTSLKKHIDGCRQCQDAVAQYKALYFQLADESDIQLPADFARTVAAQVISAAPAEDTKERWSLSFWLGIVVPAVMVAVGLYFIGVGSLFSGASDLGHASIDWVDNMTASTSTYLKHLGLRPDLSLFALLVLLVISGLDRLLRALRHGKAMLMA